MKENEKLLSVLYLLLEDELSAVNQYIINSEKCKNLKIGDLLRANKKAMEAMRHAEWLIKRIVYFDGASAVSKLIALKFDTTSSDLISKENDDVFNSVKVYNEALNLAYKDGGEGSADLLTKILTLEQGQIECDELQSTQFVPMKPVKYSYN